MGRAHTMIEVTKLNGERAFVNADLIETVEGYPDTVIALVNGRHFIVREGTGEIVERIIEYQRRVRSALPGRDRSGARPGGPAAAGGD